jgi:hypothetical protein
MERTALFSYGASSLAKERLMVSADQKEYVSCAKCSGVAVPDINSKSQYRCVDKECTSDKFSTVKIPQALLYLKYVLAVGNFVMDIKVDRPGQAAVEEHDDKIDGRHGKKTRFAEHDTHEDRDDDDSDSDSDSDSEDSEGGLDDLDDDGMDDDGMDDDGMDDDEY